MRRCRGSGMVRCPAVDGRGFGDEVWGGRGEGAVRFYPFPAFFSFFLFVSFFPTVSVQGGCFDGRG